MTFHQAMHLWQGGRKRSALQMWARAVRAHPSVGARRTVAAARDRVAHAMGRGDRW